LTSKKNSWKEKKEKLIDIIDHQKETVKTLEEQRKKKEELEKEKEEIKSSENRGGIIAKQEARINELLKENTALALKLVNSQSRSQANSRPHSRASSVSAWEDFENKEAFSQDEAGRRDATSSPVDDGGDFHMINFLTKELSDGEELKK